MSSHFNKLAVIEGIKALPKDFVSDDLTRLFIEMLPFCLLLCSDTVAEIATADFIILYHFERWRQHEGYIYASKTKVPSKAELCKFIWLRHALISCCHRMLHWRQETIAGSLLYVDYGLWPNPPSTYTQTRTQTHTHHSPNINTSVLKFHSNRNVTTTTTSNQPPRPQPICTTTPAWRQGESPVQCRHRATEVSAETFILPTDLHKNLTGVDRPIS